MKRFVATLLVWGLIAFPQMAKADSTINTNAIGSGWWFVTKMANGVNYTQNGSTLTVKTTTGGGYSGGALPFARAIATSNKLGQELSFDYGAGEEPFQYNIDPEFLQSLFSAPIDVLTWGVTGTLGADTQPVLTTGPSVAPSVNPDVVFWQISVEEEFAKKGVTLTPTQKMFLKQNEGKKLPGELDVTIFLEPQGNGNWSVTRFVYTFFIDYSFMPPADGTATGFIEPCKPSGNVAYSEQLTRTIPTGDGRYQFITRSDRGSTANYSVFNAEEEMSVDRALFRDYNTELAQYLVDHRAPDREYEEPKISTDFIGMLTQAGLGTVSGSEMTLLMEQVEFINGALRNATPAELAQVKTTQGRVQFWTKNGMYDRWTPREIAFANAVSFPVAMQTEITGLILGASLGDGSAQMALPSTTKTVAVVTVLENQEALAQVWRDVTNGKQVNVDEIALMLTDKDAIQKAIKSMGLGGNMADNIKLALKSTAGTSDDAILRTIADKLDKTPVYDKAKVKSYLSTVAGAWGAPTPIGEVSVEKLNGVQQALNSMSCGSSGNVTAKWFISQKLSN